MAKKYDDSKNILLNKDKQIQEHRNEILNLHEIIKRLENDKLNLQFENWESQD